MKSLKINPVRETDKEAMSAVYTAKLMQLIRDNKKVTDIEADLARSLIGGAAMETLSAQYPDQYIDCGIQEAHMMSFAAGLSIMGYIPFIHSFASFASRRIADQAFISGCYADANVRIIGTDPGVLAQYNGGTHMPFEDISIYRAYPGMVILDPSDRVMLSYLMDRVTERKGMYYIRLNRKNTMRFYEENTAFEIGKAMEVREGGDVTIIASGALMLEEAIGAAQILEQEGIGARILDMFCVKPLDEEAVVRAAKETGAVVTAENHSIHNGLGSAVADVLATRCYAPLEKVGIADRFGEVGDLKYLTETFGLCKENIAEAARRAVARKQ